MDLVFWVIYLRNCSTSAQGILLIPDHNGNLITKGIIVSIQKNAVATSYAKQTLHLGMSRNLHWVNFIIPD